MKIDWHKQASSLATVKTGASVLFRVDYNIPRLGDQWVINERVTQTLGMIYELLAKRCSVLLVSHFSRPEVGVFDPQYSLRGLSVKLSELLGKSVTFLPDWPNVALEPQAGQVFLAENTRFLKGESSNSIALSHAMLKNIDVVIMDAFACSHRSHASTVGIVSQHQGQVILGKNHLREIRAISQLWSNQKKAALIGGKKLSTKLKLITRLLGFCQVFCVGGGLANTLLAVQGYQIGNSWVEYDMLKQAELFLKKADQYSVKVICPQDVSVIDSPLHQASRSQVVSVDAIEPNQSIVDIGPASMACFHQALVGQGQVYWNGPMGVYENPCGQQGTLKMAQSVAQVDCSFVGGGDTLAAIKDSDCSFTHKSTGGGAFLHFFANQTSPVLESYESK